MSVKIRLMRMGKKKHPTYRVVVADSVRAALAHGLDCLFYKVQWFGSLGFRLVRQDENDRRRGKESAC